MNAIAKRKCAMCGGQPYSVSLDPNEAVFCSLQCEGSWKRQQREGSFLAALNLTPRPVFEAWGDLDLGPPEQAWACAVERFREEARINRQCADQQRKLSEDAAKQAEQHAARAEDFANLANAIERAPIAFAASGIETEGQDAQRLGAEHESPTGNAGDAQTPPSEHQRERSK